jgi:molecular chaperone GrpE (heat shock protein)
MRRRRNPDEHASETPAEHGVPDESRNERRPALEHPAHTGDDTALLAEVQALRSLFEERLRYDETRETHFARVYEELDAYKRDEGGELMLTLARSLLLVLDKLSADERAEELADVIDELSECLLSVGIEPIDTPIEVAAPPEQQVVGFLPAEHSQTVRLVSEGYRFRGRVVRPRRVTAKRTAPQEVPA